MFLFLFFVLVPLVGASVRVHKDILFFVKFQIKLASIYDMPISHNIYTL